jgi:hypothetical protein
MARVTNDAKKPSHHPLAGFRDRHHGGRTKERLLLLACVKPWSSAVKAWFGVESDKPSPEPSVKAWSVKPW